jgi:REP element-mobilizing transposase RayT
MWHDYDGGAYFITVCTRNCEHFFGEIENGVMKLSEIGKYTTEKLQKVNIHHPYAEIPLFVVMPNHWHAIVFIDGSKTPYVRRDMNKGDVECGMECRDVACRVSTTATPIPTLTPTSTPMIKNKQMQNIANKQGWLSVVIGGIKSAITKFAHDNGIDFAWQTRFNDRIIRNQSKINRIADYIKNNPTKWDTDRFNENK